MSQWQTFVKLSPAIVYEADHMATESGVSRRNGRREQQVLKCQLLLATFGNLR